ncbi:AI-2E family transporter [Halosolutus amylolyticus]|uniref:AI-2E family transporter n=1 Tax=Halosolutus amylolyticus TaxID=2932267 RepID=A0ABD5PU29_9EURY|nr:AI-2E family transporter [Halosolutus amylolyticus]
MDVRTTFFALLLVALGTIATLMIAPLLQYVMAAALLAFVLYPAHERLEERIGARPSAFVITGLAIVATVVPTLYVSIVLLQTTITYLDGFDESVVVDSIRDVAFQIGVDEAAFAMAREQVIAEVEGSIASAVELFLRETIGLLNASIRMSVGLLVLVFVLYYLLLDGPAFVAWLADVIPLEDGVRDELFDEVETVTRAVIQSHVLVALAEGLLGGLGFYLLGVPNVALWTVVMIVVSFLPAIGIWLVWGPAVGYLVAADELVAGLVLLVYGLTVLSIVDNYLRAVFVDHGSGLHRAAVLVGVIGGIYLLGIMGLFLGPVLLAVFKAGLNVFSKTALASGDPQVAPTARPVSSGENATAASKGENAPTVDTDCCNDFPAQPPPGSRLRRK